MFLLVSVDIKDGECAGVTVLRNFQQKWREIVKIYHRADICTILTTCSL